MAAHEDAAVFDLSSFGKIDVVGKDAEVFLMQTCAGYMNRKPGSVIYSAVLNEQGHFESDITAQRISNDHYRLFVGTQAIKKDLAWFTRAAAGNQSHAPFDVVVTDVTERFAAIALMGPSTLAISSSLGDSLESIDYFKHTETTLAGISVRAARLSYVGEAGWEITCKSSDVVTLYNALRGAGVKPAGLFAQTSMRIEKGFRAMGHELDSDVSPADVGLQGFTRKTGGYLGHEAMLANANKQRSQQIVSLTFADDSVVPIGYEPVIFDDEIVGKTTSCAFGYRVGKPIALAQVSSNLEKGSEVEIDLAGTRCIAQVTNEPLFDPAGIRMKFGVAPTLLTEKA